MTPRGTRRILYVSDPSSILTNVMPEPTQPQDLRRWVDMLASCGVDTFEQEIFSQGWTHYWRSGFCEYDRRPWHRRLIPLLDSGVQPLEILIDQSRKRGLSFLAGFRVNDNHGYIAVEQGVGIASVVQSHPEWWLRELPDEQGYKLSSPLDFSHEPVRQYLFDVIEESVKRFDVDGIELCYRDHAYFPWGKGRQRAPLMTDLLRRLRAMLDQQGQAKGKRLLMGARVFSTLEECADLGLDVPAWTKEGLLDFLCPADVMYADFNVPYEEFAALTRSSNCMLYPGLLPWTSLRARRRLDQIPLTPANYRALATTCYGAGADGLSIYNHFSTCWHAPFYPQTMQTFHQLREPERIAAAERHYIFDPTWAGLTLFGQDRCSTGAIKASRVILDRSAPGCGGEYAFNLYEDLARAAGATLAFRGFGLTEDDELEIALNGRPIDSAAIGRTRASDAPVQWDHVRRCGGRLIKSIPEQGRINFAEKEPAFSTRWFALPADQVRQGRNSLAIALNRSDPDAAGSIVIDEIEIWVQP